MITQVRVKNCRKYAFSVLHYLHNKSVNDGHDVAPNIFFHLHFLATKVFATFETEGDQRRVVQEMAVGSHYIRKDDKSVIKDPKYLCKFAPLYCASCPRIALFATAYSQCLVISFV